MLPAPNSSRALSGRIMIVSDRPVVIAELEPILRATEHLCVSVPNGVEARRVLREGVVPDLLISDLGSERALEVMEYMGRFLKMNRVGRHLVVEDGAPFSRAEPVHATLPRAATPLRRPFDASEVTEAVEDAIRRMDRDIRSVRGEVWREIDRLRQAGRGGGRETRVP